MELSVGAEASGGRWRQLVGVKADGGRRVVGTGGPSRVVNVGAIKHNNLRCHSPGMSNLRNIAEV